MTNAHVVDVFGTIIVKFHDGQSHQGTIVDIDENADLALMVVRASRGFESVSLGNSRSVAVGEDVIAIGFPSGNTDVPLDSPTITRGIVSAKRSSASGVELLQTDAALNPGNSGGPLFDREGRVIGVTTSKLFESKDGRPIEGIGLAVAVNEVGIWLVSIRNEILSRRDSPPEPTPLPDPTPTPTTAAGSFVSLSSGSYNTCGVKTNGSVVCWGSNNEGGGFKGKSTPPAGSFASVSTGISHTCGVRTDGSVVCWGSDGNGRSTPPSGSFVSISAGASHTCGVKTNGAVECWGYGGGFDGSLGVTSPPVGSFVSVGAGWQHTCGVKADGAVECWGNDYRPAAKPPTGSFVSVSAGQIHTCGVRSNGTVECWGIYSAARPPHGSFVSVSAGEDHTCGVRTDGSVVCWGDDEHGKTTPPTGSFVSVSAGEEHTCGIRTDGSVLCWGHDRLGALGR